MDLMHFQQVARNRDETEIRWIVSEGLDLLQVRSESRGCYHSLEINCAGADCSGYGTPPRAILEAYSYLVARESEPKVPKALCTLRHRPSVD